MIDRKAYIFNRETEDGLLETIIRFHDGKEMVLVSQAEPEDLSKIDNLRLFTSDLLIRLAYVIKPKEAP